MRSKNQDTAPNQLDLVGEIEKQTHTDEQRKFIEYRIKGDSIVLASTAGSGKTFSCIQRLRFLLENGIKPHKIIFFSFTNAATEELKQRIGRSDVHITTIHAFCLSILSKTGKFKKIVTFFDFINWFKERYKPLDPHNNELNDEFYRKINDLYDEIDYYSSAISAYKLQLADDIKTERPAYFDKYCEFLKEVKGRDFSDMLIEVRDLFKEDKWLNMFKNKYDYIFIDEYQDTSTIQMQILLTLNAKYYYLIGDRFQAIFGYSGVSCNKIEEMLKRRRKTKEMSLTVNFRSDKSIIKNSNKYTDLQATGVSEKKGIVNKRIILTIEHLIDVLDRENEVAVLVRTNSVIKQLELELLKRKYPLRYFNYITATDIKDFQKGEISLNLERKLNKLKKSENNFANNKEIFEFIDACKDSKKFITTIHKSKGREFDACIVVNSVAPDVLHDCGFLKLLNKNQLSRISFDINDIDPESKNIHYVAVSRSKHNLYFMIYDY